MIPREYLEQRYGQVLSKEVIDYIFSKLNLNASK
jgi:hypothetical protein